MPIQSRYVFSAAMDVDPKHEAVFNQLYDTEHVPFLLKVPGVVSAARFKTEELKLVIGGELRTIVTENEPRYSALYEIESPDVLTSQAWSDAVDRGRWPHDARPHTKNKRWTLLRRLS